MLLKWGCRHRYRNTNVFIDICLRTRTHTHTQFLALEGELTPILVSLVSKDQVEVRGISLKTLRVFASANSQHYRHCDYNADVGHLDTLTSFWRF